MTARAFFTGAFLVTLVAAGAMLAHLRESTIRVIDGDTVAMGETVVRLVGLNAPETGSGAACIGENALGGKARAALQYIVDAYPVELTIVPCACEPGTEGTVACNFGRFCGTLRANGADVAGVLIAAGLAAPYRCGATSCPKLPRPWCGSP